MSRVKIIYKPWGSETIIEQNDKYMVKELFMRKGECCSLQKHEHKHETIFVLHGELVINYEGEDYIRHQGQFFVIEPGKIHRMSAVEDDCKYLECSTPENEDVVRLEDKYGREGH